MIKKGVYICAECHKKFRVKEDEPEGILQCIRCKSTKVIHEDFIFMFEADVIEKLSKYEV